jgi:hypothetical protein
LLRVFDGLPLPEVLWCKHQKFIRVYVQTPPNVFHDFMLSWFFNINK